MNRWQEAMMRAPSIDTLDGTCAFCGRRATNRHHIVPRSQGGAKGPTVTVCGLGNAGGCHGLLHSHRLHLRWLADEHVWQYACTSVPVKYEEALRSASWHDLEW